MAFKLLYTADLHGNKEFYKTLLKKAEDENVDAVVIGGDLCNRDGNTLQEKINAQKVFLEKFMLPLFSEFKLKNKNKEIFVIMGNDDFRVNLKVLEDAEKNKILKSFHKKSVKLGKNLNIAGYSFVNPTPFRLKDWEKPDFKNDNMPHQIFDEEVRSIEKEFGTIEEDLNKLKKLSNPEKTIYVIHAPPFDSKLDIITTGKHVGSKAVRKFIEQEQAPLTLHGHIHESPKMSGSWKDSLENTLCINVGSNYPIKKLNCVIIDSIDLNKIEYFELEMK
ncbi:MAG: metallophosphoesterase [Nanoarchaeota archaeon]